MDRPLHIDIGICTFRRDSVADTIRSVDAQHLPPDVTLRILVADNDHAPSARDRILACAGHARWPVEYIHAPAGNISIARNACLDHADADWLGFIDDDEVARPDWIAQALHTAAMEDAQVVFGPALARYPEQTPRWIRDNDFHSNRAKLRHGKVETGHTSNVLMRFNGTLARNQRFDLDLGQSGGEDTDFFFRLSEAGMTLAISEKAIVEEVVEPKRLRLPWLIERRFAEGAHYGASAPGSRAMRLGASLAKVGYCGVRTVGSPADRTAAAFWFLRAVFHCGVSAGSLGRTRRAAYGKD